MPNPPSKRKGCKGKHPHKSKGAAEAHCRALARRFPKAEPRYAYPCSFCPYWHIGRKPSG